MLLFEVFSIAPQPLKSYLLTRKVESGLALREAVAGELSQVQEVLPSLFIPYLPLRRLKFLKGPAKLQMTAEAKIQGYPRNGSSPQERPLFSSPATLWFFKEDLQLFGPVRKAKLLERLGLDLADALPRDVKVLADLLERLLDPGADAKALAENPLFAGG